MNLTAKSKFSFAALGDSDSDSDDDETIFRSDKEKVEKKASDLFAKSFMQNQTFSFSTEVSKQNSIAGVRNEKESSLSSMANVLDSLGDDIKNIAKKERLNVVKKRWNFNGLSNIMHEQTPKIDQNDKYNPLLAATINEHEQNVNNLMHTIRNKSKYVNSSINSTVNSKKNDKMFRSRAANMRKARKLAKGLANADKNKYKIGKKRGKLDTFKKRRKAKNSPY